MRAAVLIAALAGALAAAPAMAQEVIAAGPQGAPPTAGVPGDPEDSPEAIGEWGRRVLAGEPTGPDAARAAAMRRGGPSGCLQPGDDRKPHGEVTVGAGTGGYREAGAVVTAPIGSCAQVTIAVDGARIDAPRRRR